MAARKHLSFAGIGIFITGMPDIFFKKATLKQFPHMLLERWPTWERKVYNWQTAKIIDNLVTSGTDNNVVVLPVKVFTRTHVFILIFIENLEQQKHKTLDKNLVFSTGIADSLNVNRILQIFHITVAKCNKCKKKHFFYCHMCVNTHIPVLVHIFLTNFNVKSKKYA
jgi:hypothetical protein